MLNSMRIHVRFIAWSFFNGGCCLCFGVLFLVDLCGAHLTSFWPLVH